MREHWIVDAHCDTILKLSKSGKKLSDPCKECHLDLYRLTQGGVKIQFFALFIEPQYYGRAVEQTFSLLEYTLNEIEENSETVECLKTAEDINRIKNNGKIGAVLAIEGGEALSGNISLLSLYKRLGIKCITLTWNNRNAIGDGAQEFPHNGLSRFGADVIKEMNRLGIIIDISHLNEAGFWDVIDLSNYPVIASHSNARSLCNHPRNLNDNQIKAIAEKNGVVCVNFVSDFLVESGSAHIMDIVKHVDYIKNLAGIDFVGIGSDFDGTDRTAEGMEDVTKIPELIKAFREYDFTEEEINKICSENVLRLLKDVL